MGDTINKVEEFYCNFCGHLGECFTEWDYNPAGTNTIRFAYCEDCLSYMLKKLKLKKKNSRAGS